MVLCDCGKEALILTSWTDRNPGRRFYGCPDQGSTCRFIGWVDQSNCHSCVKIIPGLLRNRNMLEEKVKELKSETMKLKKILFLSWVCFILYLSM
ncbi:putative transcription factor GRF family [Helianthus anomalus]